MDLFVTTQCSSLVLQIQCSFNEFWAQGVFLTLRHYFSCAKPQQLQLLNQKYIYTHTDMHLSLPSQVPFSLYSPFACSHYPQYQKSQLRTSLLLAIILVFILLQCSCFIFYCIPEIHHNEITKFED